VVFSWHWRSIFSQRLSPFSIQICNKCQRESSSQWLLNYWDSSGTRCSVYFFIWASIGGSNSLPHPCWQFGLSHHYSTRYSLFVHILNQFVSSPTTIHWAAVLRILCYLQGTLHQSLLLSSTSGDSLISWKSKKQNVVVRSSVKAEYCAMASTIAEIVWICCLLTWVSLYLTPVLCIVITRVLFRLLTINSFMNALKILRLIVILRIITFSMAPSLSPSSPLLCSWRISSQSPTPLSTSSFL